MPNQRIAGLIAIALCLMSTVASAQRVMDIEKGVRVRVTSTNGKTFSGSFFAVSADSVTVMTDQGSVIRTASNDVTRFEVSTGRNRPEGALIKGAIGLGIGALSGGLFGATSYSGPKPSCFGDCTRGQAATVGAGLGSVAGLLIGSLVGAATGHESWTAISFR